MTRQQKIVNILLLAGLALCLLHIWLPAYFVTGDGPSHTANAKIMHEIWTGNATTFYNTFYTLVYRPNPNWASHITLAILLFFLKGVWAEKILLSCYVLLFIGGSYALLKRINTGSVYWPLCILPLVFNFHLVMGFYNFSLGVAFFFFMILSWLSWLEKRRLVYALQFFLATSLSFFSHPVSYLFGGLTCFMLTLSWVLADKQPRRAAAMLKACATLALCLLPCALFFITFMNSQGGAGSVHLEFGNKSLLFLYLLKCRFLLAYSASEAYVTYTVGIVTTLLFIISFAARCRIRGIMQYDGFLASFIVLLLIYTFFPGAMFGGTFFSIRAALFVYILAFCCIAYIPAKTSSITAVGAFCMLLCAAALAAIRLPLIMASGRAMKELLSGTPYIKPQSVVMPLYCSKNGLDEQGHTFSDEVDVFAHAAQYMVQSKPLVVTDNYEALFNYFPLQWKPAVDPYKYLGTYEGIEALPPSADINAYYQKTGVIIDYVLLWCYTPSMLQNDHFKQLYAQVQAGYHTIYTSPGGRAILMERNDPANNSIPVAR